MFKLFFFVSTQQPRRSHLTRGTQQLKDLHGPKDTWQKPERQGVQTFDYIFKKHILYTYYIIISSFTVTYIFWLLYVEGLPLMKMNKFLYRLFPRFPFINRKLKLQGPNANLRINILTTEARDLANHCVYLKNSKLFHEVP